MVELGRTPGGIMPYWGLTLASAALRLGIQWQQ